MKEENRKDMIAVPVEHFFSGLKTEVDVYIQLSEDKFVQITKAGESFDLDQLKRYKVKNLVHLYIKSNEYSLFLKKQITIAGIVLKNDRFGVDKKTQIVSKVAATIYKSIQKMGFDEETFQTTKEVCDQVINLVESDATIASLFESLRKSSEDVLSHCVAVGFMAPMIAKKMNWERKETLEKLSLGGMLHDVGEKELRPESRSKPRAEWSYEEVKEYESHPYRGMAILSSVKDMPEDVIAIVYEHHENSIGQGFPRRLWDMKIHPLARIVALANTFCELTLKSPTNPFPLSPEHAIEHIERIMGQPFNKEAFAGLKRLVEDSKKLKAA